MGAGQPTKYNDGMIEKANHYVENHVDYEDLIPSIAGLSIVLDVSRKTLQNWANAGDDFESQEFLRTLDRLASFQEKKLLNGGLSGDFNATISKLALSNHGYSDKAEVDNKSSDGSMSTRKTLDDFYDK